MSEFVILGVLWGKKMESVWSSFCINYNSCRGERMKDTGRLMASLTEIGSAQEPIRISLTLISSDDMKTVSVPTLISSQIVKNASCLLSAGSVRVE